MKSICDEDNQCCILEPCEAATFFAKTYYLSMLGECVGFSEFGEFEYSPKCPFSPFCPDSIHSPDIRQPFSPDSIHSLTVTFADIRQNVTRIRHIRTSNSPFWQIWREWPLLNLSPTLSFKSNLFLDCFLFHYFPRS